MVRPQVQGFLEYARQRGAILYSDVNYRASHKSDLVKVTSNLLENFELADIVRGSDEDFQVMYNKNDADSVYRSEISFYTKKFIYTRGAQPVEVRAEQGFAKQYPVPPTKTVSTIGAGDNFNAGFVYGLIRNDFTRDDIERGLTDVCREEGVGIMAFGPLAGGRLTGRSLDGIPADSRAGHDPRFLRPSNIDEKLLTTVKKLNEIAEARGQSLAQLVLVWALRLPEVTSVLIGASRAEQVRENAKALENMTLTEEELNGIDAILAER